ncbi:hypothetical protein [Aureivirga sp. CE67]|uniref:hypothetical protein n=1 Tax=Aureivirga sp. CE67 TaxID=1788983 RepID=UPI0018CA8F69|nr:hypothetical protein [Aureivirga sp. CE67]
MNTQKIDLYNIFLVIISLVIAVILPFELFLISYAFLGPLHYLTEINWLHEKKYFVSTNKKWINLFVVLTVLMSIYPVVKFFDFGITPELKLKIGKIFQHGGFYLLTGFLFAISLLFIRKTKYLLVSLLVIIPVSYLALTYLPDLYIFVAIFLPTLIHVYLFTLLFIIYGAIKSKSKNGYYLALVLFSVPFIISFLSSDLIHTKPSREVMDKVIQSNILNVSGFVASKFNELQAGKFNVFSEFGLRMQIFISFAYTYHYLNWFSKTSIIGWAKGFSRKRLFAVLIIWLLSIGLYIYDFKTGFTALFFLSMLHVFLEFPLNILSIKEIFLHFKSSSKQVSTENEEVETV